MGRGPGIGRGASALVVFLAFTSPARAEGPVPPPARDDLSLEAYLDALEKRRLLARESGSVDEMRAAIREAETHFFDGRYESSAELLFEVTESPRFRDFAELDEVRAAEVLLGRVLAELGALRTAARYLERVLARGPDDGPYFAPAFRRWVDVALESGNLPAAIERLAALHLSELPEDAQNELAYLEGRARFDAGDAAGAEAHLARITRRGRFYANAQYLRGALATRRRSFKEAEQLFCSIASTGDQNRFTFFVDDRYFRVKDLAWLSLGRIAHEVGRSEDAFYYYFQVPQDSERVAEALFESAYAMYEGRDHETALDLLDQLEAKFPSSAHADEATLLRGYIALERCDFEEADRLFARYQRDFGPVVKLIDGILNSPTRRDRFYAQLLEDERQRGDAPDRRGERAVKSPRERLFAMLQVDPTFFRLHRDVRTLDAEAARAGRIAAELDGLSARLSGEDKPRAAAAELTFESEATELSRELVAGKAMVAGLVGQLDALARAGAARDEVETLRKELAQAGRRLRATEARLGVLRARDAETVSGDGEGFEALLARDRAEARKLPSRVAAVRGKLVTTANEVALRNLRSLRARVAKGLRRSRIGRIDAVMGSKRRVEIQIESLAAGRFPAELTDPLRVQGLLRDDEEYWPFEGELWQDEFERARRSEEP